MAHLIDITGHRFGRLLVVGRADTSSRHPLWECLCDCGNRVIRLGDNIRAGNTKSCGCLRSEVSKKKATIHGEALVGHSTPEYRIYRGLVARCRNKNIAAFSRYGGRGVDLSASWLNGEDGKSGFECFLRDMGRRPTSAHSIDRIDNHAGYSKENCRWATAQQQARNRRSNHLVVAWGETMPLAQALERAGITRQSFYKRVNKGMTETQAVEAPRKDSLAPK